jgi:hypothetical protein
MDDEVMTADLSPGNISFLQFAASDWTGDIGQCPMCTYKILNAKTTLAGNGYDGSPAGDAAPRSAAPFLAHADAMCAHGIPVNIAARMVLSIWNTQRVSTIDRDARERILAQHWDFHGSDTGEFVAIIDVYRTWILHMLADNFACVADPDANLAAAVGSLALAQDFVKNVNMAAMALRTAVPLMARFQIAARSQLTFHGIRPIEISRSEFCPFCHWPHDGKKPHFAAGVELIRAYQRVLTAPDAYNFESMGANIRNLCNPSVVRELWWPFPEPLTWETVFKYLHTHLRAHDRSIAATHFLFRVLLVRARILMNAVVETPAGMSPDVFSLAKTIAGLLAKPIVPPELSPFSIYSNGPWFEISDSA